jgi:hypothetical protein
MALVLLAAVSLSPAMAQGPKLSGGSSWPGIPQRVDPSVSTAVAAPRYHCNTATTNTRGGGVTGCWSGNS